MKPRAEVYAAIAAVALTGTERLTDAMTLGEGLNLDNLDRVELTIDLEVCFSIEIPDQDAEAWRTVGDVVAYAERRAGDYLGLSIREARRESWHRHLSSRDQPAYSFAEMEPIALAVAALVEAGRFDGWMPPDHVQVDGRIWHVKRLPELVEAPAMEAAE